MSIINELQTNENAKFDRLPQVSHFDGTSSVSFRCGICRLPGHTAIQGSKNICKPCQRFQVIQKTANTFSKYSLPALLLGLSIYFFDIFSDFAFLLPILAVVFVIPIIISMSVVQLQIYRGMEGKQTIVHKLKYYSMLKYNESIYYKDAVEVIRSKPQLVGQQRQILLFYLVEYVLLENKPKPDDYLEVWSTGLGLNEDEFVKLCFDHTNIELAFGFDRGVGVLPDLWSHIKENEEWKTLVMEKLNLASQNLDQATKPERSYFLEDMYLIEEDLIEIIEEEQKWFEIDNVLVEFEPETPPSNVFESFKAQAYENAKQIEQRNLEQQANKTETQNVEE